MNELYISLVYFHGVRSARRRIRRLVEKLQERFAPSPRHLWLTVAMDQAAVALWHYREGRGDLARANATIAQASLSRSRSAA